MSPRGKSILLSGLCGLLIFYLAGDLFVWRGPLRRWIAAADPPAREVVARVFDYPITRGQLERAVRERLWLEGKSLASLTSESRKTARAAALEDLIDHELLRAKAAANAAQLTVSDAEIQARLSQFGARFDSPEELADVMKSQGITRERDLRERLAARIQQEKYVESRIGPLVRVTDAEARQWFDANRRQLEIPGRVEARHLFIPTLDHPPEVAKAKLAAALTDLTAGNKDFATLAREVSEDPATQDSGGALGWMTRARLPADFAAAVFPLALNQPTLVRTRLGWHLVEVTGRKPAEPRTFEQAKPEILAALEAVKRQQAITEFRAALRQFEAAHIEVFPGLLAE